MNQQYLEFHGRLQAWGEQPTSPLPDSNNEGSMHLSPQKFVQIESWRKEVNKNFQKTNHAVKFPAFMHLSASAYKSSDPKISAKGRKSRSAEPRVKSASLQQGLLQSNFNSLATRLASISIHYSNNRKELHENKPPLIKSMVIENNGYHATEDKTDCAAEKFQSCGYNLNCSNTISTGRSLDTGTRAVIDDSSPAHNQPYPYNQTEKQTSISNYQLGSKKQSPDIITNPNGFSEKKSFQKDLEEKSETLSDSSLGISSDLSDSSSGLSMSGSEETLKPVLAMRVANRSTSNNLLNVLSIDDCKMACRYRPCVLKERQKGMIHGWSRENTRGDVEEKVKCSLPATPSGDSYGRSTALYTTESSSTHITEKPGRKRLKTAMDIMLKDSQGMNNRILDGEKNFSDRQVGSATFQRLNATLRKHISEKIEEKSQRKTRIYEERKRRSVEKSGVKVVSEELRKI